jgi:predicted PurR-regulated permease PerM
MAPLKTWFEKYFLIKNRRHRVYIFIIAMGFTYLVAFNCGPFVKEAFFPPASPLDSMEKKFIWVGLETLFEYFFVIFVGFLFLASVQGLYNFFNYLLKNEERHEIRGLENVKKKKVGEAKK